MKGEEYRQCKKLLLLIHLSDKQQTKINSIDEAERYYGDFEEKTNSMVEISPEEEFWGHCSNLQAWAENRYDTRLLHHSLSFPLLAKLYRSGEPLAKVVFKEEIIKRYGGDDEEISKFLHMNSFTAYLTDEEYFKSFLVEEEAEVILHLESRYNILFEESKTIEGHNSFFFKDKHILSLHLANLGIKTFPLNILELRRLLYLNLKRNFIEELPDDITKLKSLERINLDDNELKKIPEGLLKLKSLKELSIKNNPLLEKEKEKLKFLPKPLKVIMD